MQGNYNMFMYSQTVLQPSTITPAIFGAMIIVAQGSQLSLLRPGTAQGKVHSVLTIAVFGIIRSGSSKAPGQPLLTISLLYYVIVGSDSGHITILEYQPQVNKFRRLHLETFGKSRVLRVIPGQFLACDPNGRRCLISSVVKTKLVDVLNRNAQAELTISSGFEAHKPHCPVFALVALDVGYDNPVFAALEDATGVAYENIEKMRVNYELDIGLNHLVRMGPDTVDRSANILFQVPGGADGSWGFLVCAEDSIYYRHNGRSTYRVPIPRHVMHLMRGAFFFLLQTEDGDLLKVTLDYDEESGDSRKNVEYFDIVPIASSLFILKSGFLFVLGADDVIEFSSYSFSRDPLDRTVLIYLHGRAPENISLVEAIDSMNHLTTKPTNGDEFDAYIVLSFTNGTPVLSTRETVEEVTDSGTWPSAPTLAVQQLGEEALLQAPPRQFAALGQIGDARQVAVALSSGEIVYIEIDSDGQLMSGTVTCLSLGEVPERRVQSPFWELGCDDATKSRSLTLYLHIVLDTVTAELTDTRTRFLGPKPVQIFKVIAQGLPSVLPLSSRSWLGYSDARGQFMLTPLTYPTFEWGWTFRSEQCPQGMVGSQGQNLRIFTIEKLRDNLKQESIPLSYTPRKMLKHLDQPVFYVAEADANTLSVATKQKLRNSAQKGDTIELAPTEFGNQRGEGHRASCIYVVDPISNEVTERIELEGNETTISIAAVSFSSRDDEWFLVRFLIDGKELEPIHKPKVDQPAVALLGFQGSLLAEIGKELNINDSGMKQLLRNARSQVAPNLINVLETQGSRIRVLDVQESVTFVVYGYQDKRLIPFAGDMIPRFTKCTATVDYETVAGGDRFGNFWIFRCAQKASDESDEDPAGGHLMHKRSYLQVAPNPMGLVVAFVSREYEDLFQTLEQYMRTEDAPIAGKDQLLHWGYYVPVKGVIDMDSCENCSLLSRAKKSIIAAELDRSVRDVERNIDVTSANVVGYDMRRRVAY
ncbi:CPSF A subunit region-domain-containing protein [Tuber indicum]|nr:CPSF A subunit region-domain-containing protein [Tuber indicum]